MTSATLGWRAEIQRQSGSLAGFDDGDHGRPICLIWSRPDDQTVSAPRQALSGWSGRGYAGETGERRDADGDSADDCKNGLPGR